MTQGKTLPRLESVDRISKIPVVETGFGYASGVYLRIKKSNSLVSWSLDTVEDRIHSVAVNSLPLLEMPIGVVDSLVCKTLDEVEHRVPAIKYPPEQLINITRNKVSSRIVQPVLQRADSVKEFSLNNPHLSKYGEMAVTGLDTALVRADEYVDKYLPDATDSEAKEEPADASHAKRTMQHANRLTRKLQRRLTKRTIAVAQAMKKNGNDVAQFIYFSVDLLIKDPKEFVAKMRQIWAHLSEDEPENQIPPETLDQSFALLARETARHFVHAVNYSIVAAGTLPDKLAHLINTANHQAMVMLDSLIKAAHLERVKAIAIGRAEGELNKFVTRLNEMYQMIRASLEYSQSAVPRVLKPVTNASEPAPPTQHSKKSHKKEKKGQPQSPQNGNADAHPEMLA